MKKMKKSFYLIILIVIIASSCKKDDKITYDPKTEAKVNGGSWYANKLVFASFSSALNDLWIHFVAEDGSYISINCIQPADTNLSKFIFLSSTQNFAYYGKKENDKKDLIYKSSPLSGALDGTLYITKIDTVSKHITGTYNLKFKRGVDNDSVKVTQGIFLDLPYGVDVLPTDTFGSKIDNSSVLIPMIPIKFMAFKGTSKLVLISNMLSFQQIKIILPSNITKGSYTFGNYDSDKCAIFLENYSTLPNPFISTSGNINITEHNTTDKIIKGNFSFNCKNSDGTEHIIKEGIFSVRYE